MVLVDSSAWIEALRRNGDLHVKLALENLLEAYEAQWCAPVRLEVLGGARKEERLRLGRHFSVIPYRPACGEDWDRAIALAWRLRDGGLTVPWLDVLIAAIAIHDDVRLYAVDKHFPAIAEKTPLRLYRPGYGGMFAPDE
jgi:predicted nucleic acid-binding protein